MQVTDRLVSLHGDHKEYAKFLQKTIWRRIRKFQRSKFTNLLNNLFVGHPNQENIVNELLALRDRLTKDPNLDLNKEIVNVFNNLR